jgi:hypothetical protein
MKNKTDVAGTHTPGPWEVKRQAYNNADAEFFIKHPGVYGGSVCRMWAGGDNEAHILEAEANARLIAAAPDLLEAAKDAQAMLFERIQDSNLTNGERRVMNALYAAIAKAEGR